MTSEQIALIRATWQQVVPIADAAARLFYERLFVLDPALRSLFAHADMDRQRNLLLQALGRVVASADRLNTLAPALEDLGRRHVAYGVEDQHYDVVGAALLQTLELGLGEAFTDPVREAWTVAYTGVATLMRAGARQGAQAA
jgi:hemoglobin-like flavoprotein